MRSTRVKFQDESMNFLWSEAWKMLVSITQHKMALTEQQSLKENLTFCGERSLQVDYIILRSINDIEKEERWDILIVFRLQLDKENCWKAADREITWIKKNSCRMDVV